MRNRLIVFAILLAVLLVIPGFAAHAQAEATPEATVQPLTDTNGPTIIVNPPAPDLGPDNQFLILTAFAALAIAVLGGLATYFVRLAYNAIPPFMVDGVDTAIDDTVEHGLGFLEDAARRTPSDLDDQLVAFIRSEIARALREVRNSNDADNPFTGLALTPDDDTR